MAYTELEDGLKVLECQECRGRWIQSFYYWKWREKHGKSLPERPAGGGSELPVRDTPAAKLCPECGHILIRYPVGHEVEFRLDRCGNCGGIWLDRNEWENLKQRNLHDDIHKFFSATWQRQVREEESKKSREFLLREKFGDRDYDKLIETKNWITEHALSHEILAFLEDRG